MSNIHNSYTMRVPICFTFLLLMACGINQAFPQVKKGEDITGKVKNSYFGYSVSLSSNGNMIAISAMREQEGCVRIFEWKENKWQQKGKTIKGERNNDCFGSSASLSANGHRVAIGAKFNSGAGKDAGHVRVYQFIVNEWLQVGDDIEGKLLEEQSGYAISLSADGNRVAIGSPYNGKKAYQAGRASVYELKGDNWIQIGGDIHGEKWGDQAGYSVALSANGDKLVIGFPEHAGKEERTGYARIFELKSNKWLPVGNTIIGEASNDWSGCSVSLSADGNFAAIGASGNDDGGHSTGHARVYFWDGISWTQIGNDIDGDRSGISTGKYVAFSDNGNRIAVGASGNFEGACVKIYERQDNKWSEVGRYLDTQAQKYQSGSSISFSSDGKTIAIGLPPNAGTEMGTVQIFYLRPAITKETDKNTGRKQSHIISQRKINSQQSKNKDNEKDY